MVPLKLLLVQGLAAPYQMESQINILHSYVQVPFTLVFTKTDKRKKKVPAAAVNIKAFCDQLLQVCAEPADRHRASYPLPGYVCGLLLWPVGM